MTVFTTNYKVNGVPYGGRVCAINWIEAQQICDSRGKGEVVDGELIAIYPASEEEVDFYRAQQKEDE